ncbi:hypothetical protein KC318_g57 [Hortaea werneckii]|nr:hypothetical protein KC334_g54 [Hortaea werneckii]KAI7676826.1 hypothetical protein KC318_g57 [Hortaea werneckii]
MNKNIGDIRTWRGKTVWIKHQYLPDTSIYPLFFCAVVQPVADSEPLLRPQAPTVALCVPLVTPMGRGWCVCVFIHTVHTPVLVSIVIARNGSQKPPGYGLHMRNAP